MNILREKIRGVIALLSALLTAVALASVPATASAVILWGSTGNTNALGGGRVYTIDTDTAAINLIGDTGLNKLDALAFDNAGVLYGVTGGSIGPANLYTISTTDATPTLVGAVSGVQGIGSIDFDSANNLFAGAWNPGRLATLDPADASLLTNIVMAGSGNAFAAGLAFAPDGTLFGSRGNSSGHTEDIVTINTGDGVQTAIGGASDIITDIAFGSDGNLYGVSPNHRSNALFLIDPITGDKTFLFAHDLRLSGLTAEKGAAVPEPASLVLLSLGLLAFGVRPFARAGKAS